MTTGDGGPLLLYDGTCGFCAEVVQFILKRDRDGSLRFASLQGDAGRAILAAAPELAGADTVVWVEPSSVGGPARLLIRSDAALRIALYLGGAWRLAFVLRAIPRPLRDAAYDLVARHRHRIAGAPACVVPTPEQRTRFLD